MSLNLPNLGHGIGLRQPHFAAFLAGHPACDWLEVISENYLGHSGNVLKVLEHVRRDYPVVLHGVSLGIGNVDPPDMDHLRGLRELAHRVQPAWVSDHLCWGGYGGHYAHDLLPLPYNEEALAHVIARVQRVQDILGRQLVLENVSSYMRYGADTMPEWEFLAQVAERADCGILLDVNNVFVNAHNFGFAPLDFIHGLPPQRVAQIHLAGHSDAGAYLFDTHDGPVSAPVWDLYAAALRHCGPTASLVEWDDRIPPLAQLLAEADQARARARGLQPTPLRGVA